MDYLKVLERQSWIYGLISVALGIVLIIWPNLTLQWIARILGAGGLIIGLFKLYQFMTDSKDNAEASLNFAFGILLIIVAGYFLIRTELFTSLVSTLLGFTVVVDGVVKLKNSLEMRRRHFVQWKNTLYIALITIVLGIVLLINSTSALSLFMILTGVSLIVGGIGNFVIAFYLHKQVTTLAHEAEEIAA